MNHRQSSPHEGLWTALITPFDQHGGIAWGAYDRLLEGQAAAGCAGVVLAGTTGEGPTLTVQEKLALTKRAKALVGSRLQIMVGTGSSNTEQTVELSKLAAAAGADSLLVVTPPYNKPSLAGLEAHYKAVATAGLPICLYHVPSRTAQTLSVNMLQQLAQNPAIVSIKEASANLALFANAVRLTGKTVLSGDDPTFLASLAVGGKGCISVLSNVFPAACVALHEAFKVGANARAEHLNSILFELIEALFWDTNPSPVKAVLAAAGVCGPTLRLPLVPVDEALGERLNDVVTRTKAALASADLNESIAHV